MKDIEIRDVLQLCVVLVAIGSMLLVSRNARRATAVQREGTDLARIRDLRVELRETKDELDHVKGQVTALSRQVNEASEALSDAYRQQMEMIRYAQMPGVTMEEWLLRFDTPPRIGGRIDG